MRQSAGDMAQQANCLGPDSREPSVYWTGVGARDAQGRLGSSRASLGRLGAVLGVGGASWDHLGPVLGPLDAVLGRFEWNPWE